MPWTTYRNTVFKLPHPLGLIFRARTIIRKNKLWKDLAEVFLFIDALLDVCVCVFFSHQTVSSTVDIEHTQCPYRVRADSSSTRERYAVQFMWSQSLHAFLIVEIKPA